jgi:hypothetical protein
MIPRKRRARKKRKKIRVKGGIDWRANFVATKERPKRREVAVRAR